MTQPWYYNQDGAQYGPVDEVEVIRLIQSGELPPGTPVLKEGSKDWQPARNHACFQVEIYPKRKRAPVQPAAMTASKPASVGTSQSASQTAAQPTAVPSSPAVTTVAAKKKSILPWVLGIVVILSLGISGYLLISKSEAERIEEITELAQQGDVQAQLRLGQLYWYGNDSAGLEPDAELAE